MLKSMELNDRCDELMIAEKEGPQVRTLYSRSVYMIFKGWRRN